MFCFYIWRMFAILLSGPIELQGVGPPGTSCTGSVWQFEPTLYEPIALFTSRSRAAQRALTHWPGT